MGPLGQTAILSDIVADVPGNVFHHQFRTSSLPITLRSSMRA